MLLHFKRKQMNKIGNRYRYPELDQIFVVKSFNGFSYKFECGHWCTDNVFFDLINVDTGQRSCVGMQLTLF